MQNKPNLVRRRRIANVYDTMNYENIANWTLGQNKPKQTQFKPNQSQFPENQNECKSIL